MTIQEVYRTALSAKTINDVIELLTREQVDLMKLKKTYKLRTNLRTSQGEKARRIANALWRRGAFGRI